MFRAKYIMILLPIAGVMVAVIMSLHQRVSSGFSCVASYVQHNNNMTADMVINYVFDHDSGFIGLAGEIRTPEGKKFVLDRKVAFTYHRVNDSYYMTSTNNSIFPDDSTDSQWLEKFFPLFFLQEKKDIYMRILPQVSNRFLFFIDPIPIYICKQPD